MSEEQYEALKAEFDRIGREYNTPELARKHLFEYGMVDENGELAPQYRSAE